MAGLGAGGQSGARLTLKPPNQVTGQLSQFGGYFTPLPSRPAAPRARSSHSPSQSRLPSQSDSGVACLSLGERVGAVEPLGLLHWGAADAGAGLQHRPRLQVSH